MRLQKLRVLEIKVQAALSCCESLMTTTMATRMQQENGILVTLIW